jgi:D-alanyl-D-alanine dipeptidase
MPSEFDDFSEKAHPDYTDLTPEVIENRTFLFNIMSQFGFTHYPTEWWHFDFSGWENYPLMDLSFEELIRM